MRAYTRLELSKKLGVTECTIDYRVGKGEIAKVSATIGSKGGNIQYRYIMSSEVLESVGIKLFIKN